jgi:hypothetical protein
MTLQLTSIFKPKSKKSSRFIGFEQKMSYLRRFIQEKPGYIGGGLITLKLGIKP